MLFLRQGLVIISTAHSHADIRTRCRSRLLSTRVCVISVYPITIFPMSYMWASWFVQEFILQSILHSTHANQK